MPALDINGNPVAGAKLTFYVNETTTLLAVYTTSALNVAHPNPVSADAAGAFPSIFADTAVAYSVAVTDADGVPITGLRNRDNVMASLFYGDDYIDTAALKANNLSDLASASTARTNLGLGTMALQSASAVAITGGSATGLSAIGMAGGTVTADAPLVSGTQTWNNGAVAFTGYKLNITNTASAVASKLLDLQVGGVGKFSVDYLGVPRIGSYGAGSSDPGCVISRDMNDGSTIAGHGFVEASYFRRPGANAFAAFDVATVMAANSFDHLAAFQDRAAWQAANGTQTMTDWFGLYTRPSVDAGTLTNRYGVYVAEPAVSGGGTIGTQYGLFVAALTAGATKWGAQRRHHGQRRTGDLSQHGCIHDDRLFPHRLQRLQRLQPDGYVEHLGCSHGAQYRHHQHGLGCDLASYQGGGRRLYGVRRHRGGQCLRGRKAQRRHDWHDHGYQRPCGGQRQQRPAATDSDRGRLRGYHTVEPHLGRWGQLAPLADRQQLLRPR